LTFVEDILNSASAGVAAAANAAPKISTRILPSLRLPTLVLHRHRAGGVNLASDVGDDAVPGGVEDAAAMRCDQPIDDQATGFEPGKNTDWR
jgi:hypothetical protein